MNNKVINVDSERKEKKVTLVTLGASNAGKTSLIERYDECCIYIYRFVKERFSVIRQLTIGQSYSNKIIRNKKGLELNVNIWDTAGQERFQSLAAGPVRKAQGILFVFDLGDLRSFECVKGWIQDADVWAKNAIRYLVGNKSDLTEIDIQYIEAQQLAANYGMKYFQVSAKNGENVEGTFATLAWEAYASVPSPKAGVILGNKDKRNINKKKISCC